MENTNKIDTLANVETLDTHSEESSFDFRTILTIFLLNWQWFVLSLIIFLCGAFLYLRYKSPVYQASVKMLIKDDNSQRRNSNSQMLANMADLGFISNSAGIENEVEIIHSRFLARETVIDLRLYVQYKEKGLVKKQLVYKTQAINVDIDPASLEKMDETMLPIKMKITKDGDKYGVSGYTYSEDGEEEIPFETSFTTLPASCKTTAGTLTFTKNPEFEGEWTKDLYVSVYPPMAVAKSYEKSMTVEPTSKMTSIALITVQDYNKERAVDFLEQLAICYNRQANADKNEIAVKTEEFINGRLEKISAELGVTETELEKYKKRNNLTQMKLDATETLAQTSQYSTKLSEAQSQIQMLDFLREYVDNPANRYQIIPSNVGLTDVSSTALINKYNQSVLDRNRMLRTVSEISPQVQTLTSALDDLENSIRTALSQARHQAKIQLQGIERQYSLYTNKVANAPEQERVLTQIGRQQEIKSGLYLMLLQKREENSISLSATADKGKLIDYPLLEGKVSPKGSIVMLVGLVLGIGLPLLVIYLVQMMRFRIEGHDDVAKLTKLPIIADVALSNEEGSSGIVVRENQNNQIDEIFRAMRTNIQFMLEGNQKVIMFTSSTSGEGKTFNAVNLAVSFATLGKKVIVMGLDIRKPRLAKIFNLSSSKVGVTNLLVKDKLTMDDIRKEICPSGVSANLDVLAAGPCPPNPTELLARKNLDNIVEALKTEYDYVIMDTAPVGLVTDSLQIGKLADVTVIVCRADYTPKSTFELFNRLHAEKKLPNMCYVLNGIDMSKKKHSYYYGYSSYGHYTYKNNYGGYTYGTYANSHYGNKEDKSIKL